MKIAIQSITGIFILVFITSVTARMSTLKSPVLNAKMQIEYSNGWAILNDYSDGTLCAYDPFGIKHPKINQKTGCLSIDRLGNYIGARRTGECVYDAIYFTREGKATWRYQISQEQRIVLSPNGKYALLARGQVNQFDLFAVEDTSMKCTNPFIVNIENAVYYTAEFTSDGNVLIITDGCVLIRYNPDIQKVESQTSIKSPEGDSMILSGDQLMASNIARTRFAVTAQRVGDFDYGYDSANNYRWVLQHKSFLLFDGQGNVVKVIRPSSRAGSGKPTFAGDYLIFTALDSGRSAFSINIANSVNRHDSIVTIDTPYSQDRFQYCGETDSVIFYSECKSGFWSFDLRTKERRDNLTEVPFFSDRKNTTSRQTIFVPVVSRAKTITR